MQDDLQKAYSAYQQALYLLPNPKEDPKLWYGIGILYDRYGSLDHAEEAFASVLQMDKGKSEASFDMTYSLSVVCRLRQGKRNSFPPRHNIQTARKVYRIAGVLRSNTP